MAVIKLSLAKTSLVNDIVLTCERMTKKDKKQE